VLQSVGSGQSLLLKGVQVLGHTKVARTIYIEGEQLDALKKLSQKTKVPQSVYVREALDMLLEKYSDQLRFEFKESFKG
jgi:hypothetical protein